MIRTGRGAHEIKRADDGATYFSIFLAVFVTHMLATTNRMIRTGRGAYESSRADEGPGPLTFLFFERWALVARDACGGLVIIDGCPLTGISPHRVRLRRILQRGPPTRTNPAHVATIDLRFMVKYCSSSMCRSSCASRGQNFTISPACAPPHVPRGNLISRFLQHVPFFM